MASSTSKGEAHTHSIQSNLDGFEDLRSFLAVVPEVLEDQDARIEGLDERIEEGLETVEKLELSYESLLANFNEAEEKLNEQQAEVEALREEVDGIRDDLDAIRGLFSSRVLDKEDSHLNAQQQDATDIVDIGDTRTVVVDDTEYDDPRDPKAIAHINGLVTFVSAPEKDLNKGDKIEVRISDVGETHARALRTEA